jgi:hypothetical protein
MSAVCGGDLTGCWCCCVCAHRQVDELVYAPGMVGDPRGLLHVVYKTAAQVTAMGLVVEREPDDEVDGVFVLHAECGFARASQVRVVLRAGGGRPPRARGRCRAPRHVELRCSPALARRRTMRRSPCP